MHMGRVHSSLQIQTQRGQHKCSLENQFSLQEFTNLRGEIGFVKYLKAIITFL